MPLNRVAVIYKKSNRENLQERGLWDVVEKQEPFLVSKILRAHEKHASSLQNLRALLDRRNISHHFYRREEAFPRNEIFDLFMSLGGDGTFLYCTQQTPPSPLLGINSAPGESVGHYCKFNALDEISELDSFLTKSLEDMPKPQAVERLQVFMDGEPVDTPILNDVLVTESNPAEISSYLISYSGSGSGSGKTEWHKSSGVWISTSGGSSAAYRSAGGEVFPAYNAKNKRQYGFIVRELYGAENTLRQGLVSEEEAFEITSNMMNGVVYIDGFRTKFPFPLGSKLSIRFHPRPLLAYV